MSTYRVTLWDNLFMLLVLIPLNLVALAIVRGYR